MLSWNRPLYFLITVACRLLFKNLPEGRERFFWKLKNFFYQYAFYCFLLHKEEMLALARKVRIIDENGAMNSTCSQISVNCSKNWIYITCSMNERSCEVPMAYAKSFLLVSTQ